MIALLLLTIGLAGSPQDTLSPAARRVLTDVAGLKADDVITAIGDKHIGNLYDMTDALRSHQPGDTVVVVSRRDGVERRAPAVLGKRT